MNGIGIHSFEMMNNLLEVEVIGNKNFINLIFFASFDRQVMSASVPAF